MATQFAVDLVFKSQGTSKLKDATDKLGDLEKKAKGAQQGATNAANGIRGFGRAAGGAVGGVRALGAAVQAALGPLAIAGGAVGALTAAFQTLAQQDFAEAKVRTLGVNSKDLVKELKNVSAELKGQASVAELTGAAYDVASAGFNNAADAAKVLKAASLGATGGFSDINTVGNAATSVLNAYGLSADHAASLVDKFVQTQNDGKIVVAEYASEIGKVASVAAGLGVSIEEVNAVIAQATASGVKSEVAFTGLKTALAQLASGQATERMKELGLTIDANTIASDGLVGTLKKIKASGADMGQVLKLLGTESGPALAPVLNNLEKFDELLAKQKNSAGASAAAQKEAANTIQGAWKALQTQFSNFFSEQSALGDVLKVTLQVLAYSVETLAKSLNFLLAPFKAILQVVGSLAGAIDKAFNVSQTIETAQTAAREFQGSLGEIKDTLINDLADAFEPVTNAWSEGMDFLGELWGTTTQLMGQAATEFGSWVQGVWGSIASGAQNIIAPIAGAFQAAFAQAWSIIQGFWNSLPGWLKGALSAAGSVVGGVAKAVGNAINSVRNAAGSAIQKAQAGGAQVPGGALPGPVGVGGGGGAPAAAGGGGKGGKGGGVDQTAQLQQQLALKRQLFAIEQQMQAAILAGDKVQIAALERKKIEAELDNAIIQAKGNGLKVEIARLEAAEKLATLEFKTAEQEKKRKESLDEVLTKFDREIELAGIKGDEAKKLKQIEYDILDLRKQGLLVGDEEIEKYRQRAQAAAQAGGGDKGKVQAYMDNLQKELGDTEGMITSLAQTVEGEIGSAMSSAITGMIDGTKTAQEAFSDMLKGIGKAFIDMATQMIAKYLVLIAMQSLFRALGGPSLGGGGGASGFGFGETFAGGGIFSGEGPFKFAEGGYVTGPTNALIGEAGESEYVIPSSKMGAAMANYKAGKRGDSVVSDAAGGSEAQNGGNNTFTLETVVINSVEYATVDQVRAMSKQAAKQGAEGGYTKTLGSLRNSRATRARIGMG